MAEPDGRLYLVYGDNGMRLVYSGTDRNAWEAVCSDLARTAAGYVSGYQFVGRQRVEVRCYLGEAPSAGFIGLRSRRDLFDFAWHPKAETVD